MSAADQEPDEATSGDAPHEQPSPVRLPALVGGDRGDRPAVTFSDPGRGERTELGHATLSNWADKTANLLTLELDLEPGDVLPVDAGSHWTTLAVLLGAWRAGLTVGLGAAPAGGPAVIREDRLGDRGVDDEVIVIGTGMAARLVGDGAGGLGYAEEVLAMPDEFAPAALAPDQPALTSDGVAVAFGPLQRAADLAAHLLGLDAGQRAASARPLDTVDGLVTGPLAAWSAEATPVLTVGSAALAGVAEQERADVIVDDDPDTAVRCLLDERGQLRVRAGRPG